MASKKSGEGNTPIMNLALIAWIVCAFYGYSHGGWPGAGAAAFVAFTGVHLAFATLALAIRVTAGAVVVILMLASLQNRIEWLSELTR